MCVVLFGDCDARMAKLLRYLNHIYTIPRSHRRPRPSEVMPQECIQFTTYDDDDSAVIQHPTTIRPTVLLNDKP